MHLSTSIHMRCPAACSYIFTLLQARTAAVAHGRGVWLPGLLHVWQLIPINYAQACRSQPWTSVGWKSGGLHEVPLPPRRAGQGHFSLSMLCSKHTLLWLLCMLACVVGPPLSMAPIHAPYCSCSVPGGSWARLSAGAPKRGIVAGCGPEQKAMAADPAKGTLPPQPHGATRVSPGSWKMCVDGRPSNEVRRIGEILAEIGPKGHCRVRVEPPMRD